MADGEGEDRGVAAREAYLGRLLGIRGAFDAAADRGYAGVVAIGGRSAALDGLIGALWADEAAADERLGSRVAVIAVGGFGRQELFPSSDVDLLFCWMQSLPRRMRKRRSGE